MKRRCMAILLVLALLLAGCAKEETEKNVTKAKVEKVPEITAEPAPVETAAATEPAPRERTVTMGRLEGNTYINEYTGYACALNGNWAFMSAEELQELPENVHEMIKDSELGEKINVANQFTDMLAENADQLVTINVLYQKISAQEQSTYAKYDEREILDAAMKYQDQLIEAYAQGGFDVEKIEMVSVNFLGEQRWAMRTTSTTQGVPYYALQIFDYHLGSYSVTLTLASFVEDNTEDLLDLFYSVA